MADRAITVKMMPEALRLLRLIAATTGEKQYEVLTRLLGDETKRLGIKAPKAPLR